MAKAQADKFANQAVITVVESGANTLTFKKLETGISLFEKMAWLISRIEWFYASPIAALFNGDTDQLLLALTATDQITSLSLTNAAILDMIAIQRLDFGTPANSYSLIRPHVKDLSTLPGGGIICPPNPFYAAAQGVGLASATTSIVKVFYTNYELSADEYWELVESRRIVSS
jgi:hypothetical protein